MLLNLTWVKEFVPITASVEDICNALTQRGLEVEGVEKPFRYLQSICIGEVLSCEKHPKADTLSVCNVSLGEKEYVIVCGANNVRSGIRVPVATEGTIMPNGLTITKTALRGIDSCGMICSEAELGIKNESDGIWILPHDAPLGMSLAEYYSVDDTVIDISITPNRGDCLSVLGLARELALYYTLPLTMPKTSYTASSTYTDAVTATVEEECSTLYSMQSIRNIGHGITPASMRFRLLSVGIRPLSLIVDITNYVMMELGQPLHAFDASSVEGNAILVQHAVEGSRCTTLDGVERILSVSDIEIIGAKGILAIAGVMGCASSEITQESTSIVLESAVFNPVMVRKTAKRLGISSEASYRFERGVNRAMVDIACDRAITLLLENTTAEVSSARTRIEYPISVSSILFRPEKVRSLLGINLDDVIIEQMLLSLECSIERKDFFWKITPPTYRLDVAQETDIIEEVARLYGMDSIPTSLPPIRYNTVLHATESSCLRTLKTKQIIRSFGLTETISYSFVSKSLLERLEGKTPIIELQNPLCVDYDVLRTRLLPSLLMVMQRNYNRGVQSLNLFEVASVFLKNAQIAETSVKEKETLGILLSGYKSIQEWGYSKELWDYRDCKAIIMRYIKEFTGISCSFKVEENHHILSPCVRIILCGENIGVMGRITPSIAKELDARHPVWYTEISLESLYKYKSTTIPSFIPLPLYPSISRDITFIVQNDCGVGTILDTIIGSASARIEHVGCIDVYHNEVTKEKHVTVRIVLRDGTKTLTDQEADAEREDVVRHINKAINARV